MHGKEYSTDKKKSSKTNLACFEKIGYGIEKHTANENMGEKKMADGFLAPTGKFYPKTENFHAQTARAILGQDGQTDEPIQELLRRGYILFVGFHKPGEPENLHADMDYVLGDRGIRRPKGRRPGLQNIRKSCRESSSLTSTTTRQTLRTFTSAMSACFPGAKGVPKRKRVTSGAMHRARRSRSGVMRVRPSGTVRFNEKQKMSENNLVRL